MDWKTLCLLVWIGGLIPLTLALADEPIGFNRDIRPILAENCFACHGPDSASREADLRLDRREEAVDYGAITPGEPDESEMVARIFADVPDERMPPPEAHKVLTQAQKELLRRWIAAGAEYQPHWAFLAPKRPALPAVKDAAWGRNPIDRFILAKLDEIGLKPAAEADRRTLARRAWLDVIGLPPPPKEVEAFVGDPSQDAYERLVDRLLDSPHWGEHRAHYWLDLARYADTHGIHFDNYREMWSYRDWVIDALNRNMPFDKFTVEQLAGDLLPHPTLDDLVASGFNRCNITTNEGGTIPEENLVLYTRDRTETTARTWLGLTANCAVCHDHKFDPLKQKEFYELSAFFNNTTQGAMDGNIKDTPPVVVVPPRADRPRWEVLSKQVAQTRQQIDARKKTAGPDFDRWIAQAPPQSAAPAIPGDALVLYAALDEGGGDSVGLLVGGAERQVGIKPAATWEAGHVGPHALKIAADHIVEVAGAGDFEKDQAFSFGAWVKFDKKHQTGAVVARMDDRKGFRGWDLWIENGRLASHIIHAWPGDALKMVSKDAVKPDTWNHVFVTYDGSGKAAGVKLYVGGQPQQAKPAADKLKGTIRADVPLSIGGRYHGSRLEGAALQDVRVYSRALSPQEVRQLARNTRVAWLLAKARSSPIHRAEGGENAESEANGKSRMNAATPNGVNADRANGLSKAEKDEVFAWWLAAVDKIYRDLAAKVAPLEKEQGEIRARSTVGYVMEERKTPPKAYVLIRGQYDQRGEEVTPGVPAFLPPMPDTLPRNRLGLARWLVLPEQPLTARVAVNHFWQEVFGTGIVKTSEDFGTTGEPPTHPELLDWLAVEFRESGWDVKRLFRLMLTSATYRQAAVITPEKLEKDPENRFLSRGPRFRMDAEMIRDYALAASGLLVSKIGGPSVKPYQPPGVWEAVAMTGSNTRNYQQDSGDSLYRRSLYTFWKRAAPPASMEIFNAPTREVCTARRERTNTPLQALVTLNDPQFVEAARRLAETVLAEKDRTDESRLDALAERLLARPLHPDETKVAEASLQRLLGYYRGHADDAKALVAVGDAKPLCPEKPLDPKRLAAWTMLANELMNLDEVLSK